MRSVPGAVATGFIVPENSTVRWDCDPVATAPGTDFVAFPTVRLLFVEFIILRSF
jgi:hypothetical protein